LELACINNDWDLTKKVSPKVLMTANESWMPKTTMDTLILLKDRLSKQQTVPSTIDEIIEELRKREAELKG
jgi:uncharacterized protein YaaN involved in tellurite resistance